MSSSKKIEVIVIGAGFTGLSTAYELAKKGIKVIVLEAENNIGGLAASFDVGDVKLDRFYHHWFTNDRDVMDLIDELGLKNKVMINPSNTGVYYANNFFKLSTPWDLINFKPLKFFDRIRLGLLALRVRKIKDWKLLESKTASDWLKELGGENVYKIIWEPLLKGKFGNYAPKISAVWFWNKLKLRGGSRGKSGEEKLAYLKGGFILLAEELEKRIKKFGGEVKLNVPVNEINYVNNCWKIKTKNKIYTSERVVVTTALPIIADMVKKWASAQYVRDLRRINYIGNVCLVLELDRPLSNTYWLNVNDPNFPFVGVIEHTNLEHAKTYGGRHIVYLSKYLMTSDKIYAMNKKEFLDYSFPYLKKMFPEMNKTWILKYHMWRARWSQPIVEKNYSKLISKIVSPNEKFYICTMAQIYPEDRGTNYAIREGRKIGKEIGGLY